MKKCLLPHCVALATIFSFSSANAFDPASTNLGPFDFTPTLTVTTGHDDNFRSDASKESTWFTSIQPTFTLGAAGLKSEYELNYSFIHDYYHSFSSDKSTDHFLNGRAFFDFNTRNRLLLSAGLSDTTDVNAPGEEKDELRDRNFNALYSFGAESARINLDLGLDLNRTRTQNDINEDKDLNTRLLSTTAYYRVSPRTRLLAELRHSKLDYKVESDRDSTNRTYLLGAEWEATAFTTGNVRLGRTKKDFKDSSKSDVSRNMWELGLVWAPLTYSTFNLSTRSSIEEGDDGADSIRQQSYNLGWNHEWSAFISTNANYSLTEKKYDFGRKDKTHNSSIGVSYALDRWIDLGLSYNYTDNRSSEEQERYTRNMVMLTLNVGL